MYSPGSSARPIKNINIINCFSLRPPEFDRDRRLGIPRLKDKRDGRIWITQKTVLPGSRFLHFTLRATYLHRDTGLLSHNAPWIEDPGVELDLSVRIPLAEEGLSIRVGQRLKMTPQANKMTSSDDRPKPSNA